MADTLKENVALAFEQCNRLSAENAELREKLAAAEQREKLAAAEQRVKDWFDAATLYATPAALKEGLQALHARVRELEADAKLNATMLAKQCDLARSAEAALAEAQAGAKLGSVHAHTADLPRQQPSTIIDSAPTTERQASAEPVDALDLAIMFHHTYERLAPSVGYDTRKETRIFDPESANGKLMVAVCEELLPKLAPPSLSAAVALAVEKCAKVVDDYEGPYAARVIRALAPTLSTDVRRVIEDAEKWRQSGNYIADREIEPRVVTFVNGRIIRVIGDGYLSVEHSDG